MITKHASEHHIYNRFNCITVKEVVQQFQGNLPVKT